MTGGHHSDSDHDTDELDENEASDEIQDDDIPGAIETANCRVYSTRELYEKMNSDRIDVEPPYQRDVVWPKASQSALIDSIFKNKWVPTLLFSQRPAVINNKGIKTKSKWVCMDGKQRLTSIKLFLDGEIPWYRRDKKPWYFKQSKPPNPNRMIISEDLQEVFLGRGMTTALYSKLTELQERDIFRLVQEGKPLTIGEKMQAAAGPWGEWFDELTQKYMVRSDKNPNGWSGRIANMKRGADFKTMTHMVLLIREKGSSNQPPRYMTSAALQKEMKELENTPVPDKLKREVSLLLQGFMDISTLAPPRTQYTIELNTPEAMFAPIVRGRKSMLSPVEMIWIPYMISYHGPTLSKGRLLELIELFKVDIRQRYPREVKNNTEVTRFISDWIINADLSRIQGKYTGYAVPRMPSNEQGVKPDTTGMSEMEKRNVNLPNTQKRKTSQDQSQSVEPTTPAPQTFKKPRRSAVQPVPAPSSQPQTSHPQRAPPLNQTMPAQTKSPYQSNSQPGAANPLNSLVPAGSGYTIEAQAKLAAERAKAAANGSPLAQNLLSAGPQSAASRPPNSLTVAGGPQTSRAPLQSAPTRFVSNYPPPTVRTTGFQLPVKPVAAQQSVSHNVMPKLKYTQFPMDFSRPMSAQPPSYLQQQDPRLQMAASAATPQTDLFRQPTPNPYQSPNANTPTWNTE